MLQETTETLSQPTIAAPPKAETSSLVHPETPVTQADLEQLEGDIRELQGLKSNVLEKVPEIQQPTVLAQAFGDNKS